MCQEGEKVPHLEAPATVQALRRAWPGQSRCEQALSPLRSCAARAPLLLALRLAVLPAASSSLLLPACASASAATSVDVPAPRKLLPWPLCQNRQAPL